VCWDMMDVLSTMESNVQRRRGGRTSMTGDEVVIFRRRPVELMPFIGRIDLQPVDGQFTVGDLTISTHRDDTRVTALLLHIGELSRAIQQLQIATISYINFAGLISVGALTVGIVKPERLVGVFAPYALTVVLVFLLQLYTDIERLITLREIVEAHLNRALHAPAFLGMNELSSKHRGRVSVRLVAILLAFPLLGLAYYSGIQTVGLRDRWLEVSVHWWNIGGMAFCSLVLAWAAFEMVRAHPRAKREARSTLGDVPPADDSEGSSFSSSPLGTGTGQGATPR